MLENLLESGPLKKGQWKNWKRHKIIINSQCLQNYGIDTFMYFSFPFHV